MIANDSSTDRMTSATHLTVKDAVQLLASLTNAINPGLGEHMAQVAQLARQVGEESGLKPDDTDQLEMAGMVHDIGLLNMPKELQTKEASQLTETQHLMYSEHPVIASIALEGIDALSQVSEMVLYHHEYMNGKGFPNGLSGDQIPLASRILLAASDYCRILSSWPRNMRRLLNHARRHLGAKEWKRFTYSEDPESIIEDCAERLLIKDTEGKYDPAVVKILVLVIHRKRNIAPADLVDLDALQAGMVLMDDLHLDNGRLLVKKGTKLADATIQTLQGLGLRRMIHREIYVSVPEKTAAE